MAHIYNAEIWESYGRYYVGDVSALSAGSNAWWHPVNIFNIKPTDFVLLLKNTYNATLVSYKCETNVLIFYFTSLEAARKYKNYINKIARTKKYYNY